jgi:hypothetical protein
MADPPRRRRWVLFTGATLRSGHRVEQRLGTPSVDNVRKGTVCVSVLLNTAGRRRVKSVIRWPHLLY